MKLNTLLIETNEFSDVLPVTNEEGFIELKRRYDAILHEKMRLQTKLEQYGAVANTNKGNVDLLNSVRDRMLKIRDRLTVVVAAMNNFAAKVENLPGGKIEVFKRKGFINPYFMCTAQLYAGPFDLTKVPIHNAILMQRILKSHNIAPFSQMFFGRCEGEPNGVFIGGNGKLIWRVYDNGVTKGRNVYILNQKYPETQFINGSSAQREFWLKPIK